MSVKGEIKGNPFHIFNFLSQRDNPSSSPGEADTDSGGDDLPSPFFICQSFRSRVEWWDRRWDDPNPKEYLPVDVYPHFDGQYEHVTKSDLDSHPCKLPLVPLFWCNNKESDDNDEFRCGVCRILKFGTDYLFCVSCDKVFHKECIESPLEIKHPSYPFLSLKLYYPPHNHSSLRCICCQVYIGDMNYYCPTYKLILHPVYAMKPTPILIDHTKRHPHPLTFFPKQNSLACDVCGLIKEHFPTYVCARCVFVVHQDCVHHPYVIRISRHHHRVFFTYSLPSGKLSCGVCRRIVDNNYGAYSCKECDDYFVHTKCALREDVWDGKELEGILEEPEIVVQPPFERISEGIILHFTHGHHLKLEMSKFYDESKFCQACVLPVYESSYYSCMDECDFILHKTCANAHRRKHHPLHAHPVTLKVVTEEYRATGKFYCEACSRYSCGFAYEHAMEDYSVIKLDIRCASVFEPFKYEGHRHPLF